MVTEKDSWLRREKFEWNEFFILFIIGLIANIYFVTTFSPSIDDELAAIRDVRTVWIAQGRFTVFLVESLLFPQPSTAYSPYLFMAAVLAVSYMLLVRIHNWQPAWKSYAAYALFATYPSWWLISEFSANVPSTALGFLCVSGALYLHARRTARRRLGRAAAIMLLLTIAAGAYQSLLLVFISGTIGLLLVQSLQSNSRFQYRKAFEDLAHSVLCLIGGTVLYFVLNKLMQAAFHAPPEYIASFFRPENMLHAPLWLTASIVKQAAQTYSGSAAIFGASMPCAALSVAGALLCLAAASRKTVLLPNLVLFGVLLASPFLFLFLTGPGEFPLRAMLALPYAVWLCAMLILTCPAGLLRHAGLVVLGLFQLQVVNVTSQYIATATMAQNQDRAMGFAIGSKILELQDSTDKGAPILLDVYGHTERERPSLYASADTSVTRGSFFGWDQGNLQRITGYLRVIGFDSIRGVPAAQRAALTAQFQQMPTWPHPGSVQKSGQVYLLKLGASADKAHNGSESAK